MQEPKEVAERDIVVLERKLAQTKERLTEDMPQANDKELGVAAANDVDSFFANYGCKIGITDMTTFIDTETGHLVVNSVQLLEEVEARRQAAKVEELYAKHRQVGSIIQSV